MALEGDAIAITALTSTSTAVTRKVIWSRRRSTRATDGAVPLEGQATLFRVLAFLGILNAAIGAWYYLRIVAAM